MAEYIVPGSGIVEDTATGSEIIIPGFGIYIESLAVTAGRKWWDRNAGAILMIINEEED